MAEWIDKLGGYLIETDPESFRISSEKHWQIKAGKEWITLPDHYVTGLLLVLAGMSGYSRSESGFGKLLSLIVSGIGIYLVLDDMQDLIRDITSLLERKPGW
ncbi:MAG: hypothetical protein ACFFD4_19685 [Candidatus Odinarchaeota archaeon]